jgi:hypothetical protein
MIRSTLVVDGPLALRMQRLEAAREGAIGREIMTLPLMAARLAGGFAAAAGSDVLYPAIQAALAGGGFRALGAVSPLPGMPRAVLRMLETAWRADIDLLSLPANVDRFDDLLAIETRVRSHLPPARMLPRDLRDAALCRVNLAALLLGPVTLSGIVDVDPVWRPLLMHLTEHTDLIWDGHPGAAPSWFAGAYKARPATLPRNNACRGERRPAVRSGRGVALGARAPVVGKGQGRGGRHRGGVPRDLGRSHARAREERRPARSFLAWRPRPEHR